MKIMSVLKFIKKIYLIFYKHFPTLKNNEFLKLLFTKMCTCVEYFTHLFASNLYSLQTIYDYLY